MNDAVVLVSGGAGNVGRAVTRAFLQEGARVVVPFYKTDQPTALDELRGEYGDRLHTFALDLTTERGAQQAVERVLEWGGRLDVVAHLVGGYSGGTRLVDTPMEVWDRMMDLNLRSAWLISRFAIPQMRVVGGGSLVFVSSRAARQVQEGQGAYSVSKAGLVTLVEALAVEYAGDGIRANVVLPGTIDTDANRRSMPDADHSSWTLPEQIARIIVFLAGPDAGAINGAAIPVFGRS